MNISHSKMTSWGLSHISIGKHDTILDVGCGGGGTVRKLASTAEEGKIYGIDYSEDRWITAGISEKGRLLVVAHTFQKESEDAVRIRIISSRKATKQEIKTYGE